MDDPTLLIHHWRGGRPTPACPYAAPQDRLPDGFVRVTCCMGGTTTARASGLPRLLSPPFMPTCSAACCLSYRARPGSCVHSAVLITTMPQRTVGAAVPCCYGCADVRKYAAQPVYAIRSPLRGCLPHTTARFYAHRLVLPQPVFLQILFLLFLACLPFAACSTAVATCHTPCCHLTPAAPAGGSQRPGRPERDRWRALYCRPWLFLCLTYLLPSCLHTPPRYACLPYYHAFHVTICHYILRACRYAGATCAYQLTCHLYHL